MRRVSLVRVFAGTSLGLAISLAGLLVASYRRPLDMDFQWRGELCRGELGRGMVVFDNSPQVRLESELERFNFDRLSHTLDSIIETREEIARLSSERIRKLANRKSLEEGLEIRFDVSGPERTLALLHNNLLLLNKVGIPAAWSYTLRRWPIAICVGLALPSAVIWLSARLRRSGRKGICFACSYDLTGNVSGVCPECGRKIAEVK